jgi:predicted metalloprotease with PDZ domain
MRNLLSVLFSSLYISMQAATVNYTIKIENPNSHYALVTMDISGITEKSIDVKMPVWTPGSYMIREFERNIQSVSAQSGTEKLSLHKTDKNTWHVDNTKGQKSISVQYAIYCFEPTVRTSYIDNDHAFLLLTSCLMYTGNTQSGPGKLKLEFPVSWSKVSTTLSKTGENEFAFNNYDELVDSPIEIGNHTELEFEVAGVPHKVAMVGANNCPENKFTADLKKVCTTMYSIIGKHPCKSYLFVVHHVEEGGGGLEHANSCVVQMPRFNYNHPDKYRGFLGLCAHEYFHLWNVKRIRPAALGPFDYSRENYTQLLWVAEGITSYYDELALYRAGFMTQKEYLRELANILNATLNRIGGSVQSLHEASFDAWIKEYRPNENSINSNISYYLKGAAIAAMLDIELQAATDGKKGLDQLMQYLYEEFYTRQSRGFSDKEFYAAVDKIAGKPLNIQAWVEEPNSDKTRESFNQSLKKIGCRLDESIDAKPNKQYTGINTEMRGEKLVVKSVDDNSPALLAGLQFGDELIAVNDVRVKHTIEEAIRNTDASQAINILISRGGLIRTLVLTVKSFNKADNVIFVEDPENAAFKAWMKTGG